MLLLATHTASLQTGRHSGQIFYMLASHDCSVFFPKPSNARRLKREAQVAWLPTGSQGSQVSKIIVLCLPSFSCRVLTTWPWGQVKCHGCCTFDKMNEIPSKKRRLLKPDVFGMFLKPIQLQLQGEISQFWVDIHNSKLPTCQVSNFYSSTCQAPKGTTFTFSICTAVFSVDWIVAETNPPQASAVLKYVSLRLCLCFFLLLGNLAVLLILTSHLVTQGLTQFRVSVSARRWPKLSSNWHGGQTKLVVKSVSIQSISGKFFPNKFPLNIFCAQQICEKTFVWQHFLESFSGENLPNFPYENMPLCISRYPNHVHMM